MNNQPIALAFLSTMAACTAPPREAAADVAADESETASGSATTSGESGDASDNSASG